MEYFVIWLEQVRSVQDKKIAQSVFLNCLKQPLGNVDAGKFRSFIDETNTWFVWNFLDGRDNDKFLIESRIMLISHGWIYATSVSSSEPQISGNNVFINEKEIRGICGE